MKANPSEVSFTDQVMGVSRIAELARVAIAAMWAVIVCSPLLLEERPKTPLRVFCIAAFEFIARLRGRTLGRERRMAMAFACDFGSLRDDYYDHRTLDASEYRYLRGKLRRMVPEEATSIYIRRLRQAERSRPILAQGTPEITNAVIAYRTSVLDVSLRWMHELSGLSIESVKFHLLLGLVGLVQIADDVLDWKEDQAVQRPSYVTAILLGRPRSAVAASLRVQADALLGRLIGGARQDIGAAPLAFAGMVTWIFVFVLVKMRFPR